MFAAAVPSAAAARTGGDDAAWFGALAATAPPSGAAAAAAPAPRSTAVPRPLPDIVSVDLPPSVAPLLAVLAEVADAAARSAASLNAAPLPGSLLDHAAATAAARTAPRGATDAVVAIALPRRLAADVVRYGAAVAATRAAAAARAAPRAAHFLAPALQRLQAAGTDYDAAVSPVAAAVRDLLRAETALTPGARVVLVAERAAFPALIHAASAARVAARQVDDDADSAAWEDLLPEGGAALVDRARAARVPHAALAALTAIIDVAPLAGDGGVTSDSTALLAAAPPGVRRVMVRVGGVERTAERAVEGRAPSAPPPSAPPLPAPVIVLATGTASALTARRSLYSALVRLEADGAVAVERPAAAGADAALPGDAALAIWLPPGGKATLSPSTAASRFAEWAAGVVPRLAGAFDRIALVAETPHCVGASTLDAVTPPIIARAVAAGVLLRIYVTRGADETAAAVAAAARGALAAAAQGGLDGPPPADGPSPAEALMASLPGVNPGVAAAAAAAAADAGGFARWIAEGAVVPCLSARRAALLQASLGVGGSGDGGTVAPASPPSVGAPSPPRRARSVSPPPPPPQRGWGATWRRDDESPSPVAAAHGARAVERAPPSPRAPSGNSSGWPALSPPPRARPPPPGAPINVGAALDKWAARGGGGGGARKRPRAVAPPRTGGPAAGAVSSAATGRVRVRPPDYVPKALGLARQAGSTQGRLAWRR